MPAHRIAALVSLAVLAWEGRGAAQPRCVADAVACAPARYQEGVELHRLHRYEQALAAFTASYSAWPRAETLLYIAKCRASLEHFPEARDDLDTLLRSPDVEAAFREPQQRQAITTLIADVDRHLGTVTVSASVPGAIVVIDGIPVGRTTIFRRRVSSGLHELTITCPDEASVTRRADVPVGANTLLEIDCVHGAELPAPTSVTSATAVTSVGVAYVPLRDGRESIPLASLVEAHAPAFIARDDGLVLAGDALPERAITYLVRDTSGRDVTATLVAAHDASRLRLLRTIVPLSHGVFMVSGDGAIGHGEGAALAPSAADPIPGEQLAHAVVGPAGDVERSLIPMSVASRLNIDCYVTVADGASPGAAIFRRNGDFAGVFTTDVQRDGFARFISASRARSIVAQALGTTVLVAAQRMASSAWQHVEHVTEIAQSIRAPFHENGCFDVNALPAGVWTGQVLHGLVTAPRTTPDEDLVAGAWLWNGAAAILLGAAQPDPNRLRDDLRGTYTRLFFAAKDLLRRALLGDAGLCARSGFLRAVAPLADINCADVDGTASASLVVPLCDDTQQTRGLSQQPASQPTPVRQEGGAEPPPPPPRPPARFGVEVALEGIGTLGTHAPGAWGATGGGALVRLGLAFTIWQPRTWFQLELVPEMSVGWLRRSSSQAREQDAGWATLAFGPRLRFGRNAAVTVGAAWPFTTVLSSSAFDYALLAWEVRLGIHPWRTFGFTAGYREARFDGASPPLFSITGALQWRVE